jgi:hypothetical protein
METMGLDEFLRGKPNVTRQEVQDFIAGNRIDVQERQLSGRGDKSGVFSEFNPDKNQFMVYGEDLSHTHAFNTAEEADNFVKQFNSQIPYGPSKYDKYQLPGGENYREILLTLPFKEPAMPKGIRLHLCNTMMAQLNILQKHQRQEARVLEHKKKHKHNCQKLQVILRVLERILILIVPPTLTNPTFWPTCGSMTA